MYYRGRLLTGRYAHFCFEWDGLPIDETCEEWPCCFDSKFWMDKKRRETMTRWQRLKFWFRCQRWYPERDKVTRWIAMHLPKRVCYWAFIRFVNNGSHGHPAEQTVMDVLKRNGDWASASR